MATPKTVYLVEDQGNAPGRIYAVFAIEEDAMRFLDAFGDTVHAAVVLRTLWYGQPDHLGYNP